MILCFDGAIGEGVQRRVECPLGWVAEWHAFRIESETSLWKLQSFRVLMSSSFSFDMIILRYEEI